VTRTAQSTHEVVGARSGDQPAGNDLQNMVTDVVAVGVVHRFESVQVGQDQADLPARTQSVFQLSEHRSPVPHTSQLILVGQSRDFRQLTTMPTGHECLIGGHNHDERCQQCSLTKPGVLA
jgi:hypothetical protein